MRTIKFRAWDKDGQIMYEPFELSDLFGANISYIQFIERDERGGKKISENFEIMQYTGLKDKNGKEIYEGDIVINEPNKKSKYEVIFTAGYCGFELVKKTLRGNLYGFKMHDLLNIKVIGNIYENPKLLNN